MSDLNMTIRDLLGPSLTSWQEHCLKELSQGRLRQRLLRRLPKEPQFEHRKVYGTRVWKIDGDWGYYVSNQLDVRGKHVKNFLMPENGPFTAWASIIEVYIEGDWSPAPTDDDVIRVVAALPDGARLPYRVEAERFFECYFDGEEKHGEAVVALCASSTSGVLPIIVGESESDKRYFVHLENERHNTWHPCAGARWHFLVIYPAKPSWGTD